ncbi:Pimeloyl-ACP methyl ester carboxylesterase [Actinomadura meyerae]|uniref:Pimeloyl-ACP methyl ester carboxylesterase n=1 Tax=Actinomadura meyerae TaxID=240840 RepID=A0A239P3M6_9ACTN|nr:alpha/beta hydrolase [Actinomadura meyerae]SNT61244.1 Pimeloyl-ACP methyl ester carboxylesterase [Actinomadura meyerae]
MSLGEEDVRHRVLDVGGIALHVAEMGAERGRPVVMCHGFPGLWYSWRHQLPVLAAAGYRAIAVDMRGYGRSERPASPEQYDRCRTVADMVGLLDALGMDDAVFVGHDFGAALVWDLPQWAPGRVKALMQLSVPRMPVSSRPPTELYARMAQQHFVHVHYFQEQGPADEELGAEPERFLANVFWALSGGYRYLDIWQHPSEGNGYLDVLPEAPPLPWPWLSKDEFAYYVDEFRRTGFTGGLNWYRAYDHVWREKQMRPDEPVTVPTMFLVGERDPVLQMMGSNALKQMEELVPGLRDVHTVEGAGHFVQMEAPREVNEAMLAFLARLG